MTDVFDQLDTIRGSGTAGYSAKSAVDQFVRENAAAVEAALNAQADEAEANLTRAFADFEAVVVAWEQVAHRWRSAAEALGWFGNGVPTCPGRDALAMIGYQLSQNNTRPAPRLRHKLPEFPATIGAFE